MQTAMSLKNSLEQKVNEAARLAAIIFTAAEWTWFRGPAPPARRDIAREFKDLLQNLHDSGGDGRFSCGRLGVARTDLGTVLSLELGRLDDAELSELNGWNRG